MLLCYLQSNEACNYAYSCDFSRCEISEIKQFKVHAITTIIHQAHYVSIIVYSLQAFK